MLEINSKLSISQDEIEFMPIRAQGAGGQNVNKVSSAVHLRFDILASSLSQEIKQALMALNDQRISKSGVIIIKAQRFRTQGQNRDDALQRLAELIRAALNKPKTRIPTKVSKGAKRRRVDNKTRRGHTKALRGKINIE